MYGDLILEYLTVSALQRSKVFYPLALLYFCEMGLTSRGDLRSSLVEVRFDSRVLDRLSTLSSLYFSIQDGISTMYEVLYSLFARRSLEAVLLVSSIPNLTCVEAENTSIVPPLLLNKQDLDTRESGPVGLPHVLE